MKNIACTFTQWQNYKHRQAVNVQHCIGSRKQKKTEVRDILDKMLSYKTTMSIVRMTFSVFFFYWWRSDLNGQTLIRFSTVTVYSYICLFSREGGKGDIALEVLPLCYKWAHNLTYSVWSAEPTISTFAFSM